MSALSSQRLGSVASASQPETLHSQQLSDAEEMASSQVSGPRFKATVYTGDRHGAGTNAKVWMELVDSTGAVCDKTRLDKIFVKDHQRGQNDTYDILGTKLVNPDVIARIDVWKEITPFPDDSWYLDKIELEDVIKKKTYIYPVHRWILEGNKKYQLYEFDAFLPQDDKQKKEREEEVRSKREAYLYRVTIENGPKQLLQLPIYENYSELYMDNIVDDQVKMILHPSYKDLHEEKNWKNWAEMTNSYPRNSLMGIPYLSIKYWKEDRWFGLQRVQGMNPVLIALCKDIKDMKKLNVETSALDRLLDNGVTSFKDAVDKKKIFIVDLELLEGITCDNLRVSKSKSVTELVAPIGVFYLNKNNDLMPIAIQLFQKKTPTNPNHVYFPTDPKNIWTLAKMFFNMAEAQHHQSCTHLGFTHIVIESMCVAANRNMSQSHPIFRLMAPHFIYMLPLNVNGIDKLTIPNGFFHQFMTMGRSGALQLIGKKFQKWRFDVDGNFEEQLKKRGVDDEKVLPYYPYRDDGVPLYRLIKDYVTKVVKFFYPNVEKLTGDFEVQGWVKEMATPLKEGCGFLGMPEKLTTVEQLVDIVTAVISICSMGHAAANFLQYEAYAFLPNYPVMLTKMPPNKKEKEEISEEELLTFLPEKVVTLQTMVLTTVLSQMSTKSLGEFEVQYLYNPEVVKITDEFRSNLKELSKKTKERNQKRDFKYEWLDPELVPNAISI